MYKEDREVIERSTSVRMNERGRSEIYIQQKTKLNVSALASADIRRKIQI